MLKCAASAKLDYLRVWLLIGFCEALSKDGYILIACDSFLTLARFDCEILTLLDFWCLTLPCFACIAWIELSSFALATWNLI